MLENTSLVDKEKYVQKTSRCTFFFSAIFIGIIK